MPKGLKECENKLGSSHPNIGYIWNKWHTTDINKYPMHVTIAEVCLICHMIVRNRPSFWSPLARSRNQNSPDHKKETQYNWKLFVFSPPTVFWTEHDKAVFLLAKNINKLEKTTSAHVARSRSPHRAKQARRRSWDPPLRREKCLLAPPGLVRLQPTEQWIGIFERT